MPSIVRSALVPDALTALVWVGTPPAEGEVARAFVPEVDRLILDTSGSIPAELKRRAAYIKSDRLRWASVTTNLDLADLAWLGISPLRGLLAALFDPPHDPTPLAALDEVTIVSSVDGPQARALLMLGWLGSRRLHKAGTTPRTWSVSPSAAPR